MLENLTSIIIHFISQAGYFSVFFLMTLESCLIPIPSEITLPFAGFLAQKGTLTLPLVIAFGTLGDVFGTMIAFTIGLILEKNVVLNLIKKYGKFILLSTHEYETLMGWFSKRGSIIITIAKLLPGFRTIIGLIAGLSEVSFTKALAYTFVGSLIWVSIFSYLGLVLGKNWASLGPIFRKFEIGIVAVIVLGILWYINHKLKIIKFKKAK